MSTDNEAVRVLQARVDELNRKKESFFDLARELENEANEKASQARVCQLQIEEIEQCLGYLRRIKA